MKVAVKCTSVKWTVASAIDWNGQPVGGGSNVEHVTRTSDGEMRGAASMPLLNKIQAAMNPKRLFWHVVSAAMIYLLLVFVVIPLFPPSSQEIHIKQVNEHIKKITSDWNIFKSTNAGFDLIEFRVYTGGDGMFGIFGYVISEEQKQAVIDFVTETHPPRAIYTNAIQVVAPDHFRSILVFELGK